MRRRTAFTMIELLVAMALIVFIMAILAEAFVQGLKTFQNMKAVGDMNARLRMCQSMMRDDLIADHLENKRRLSDPAFWTIGPAREGFFRVWHGSPIGSGTYYNEGFADGVPSYYATDHYLQFTSKKRGNNRKDFFTATVPANGPNVLTNSPLLYLGTPTSRYEEVPAGSPYGTYTSQWDEVAWFMRPNGSLSGNLPLYTLFRRQRVIVPSTMLTNYAGTTYPAPVDINYPPPAGSPGPGPLPYAAKPSYLELSTSPYWQGTLYFNSPRDITIPQRRFGMNSSATYPGWPLRSDGQLRYPIYALGPNPPLNYQSPNYLPDDEDCAAALPPNGLGNNGYAAASKEGTDVILTDVISFAVIPIFLVNGVATPSEDIPVYGAYYGNNYTSNFPTNPNYPVAGVFDTWSNYADDSYDYTLWNVNDFPPPAAPQTPPATLVPNQFVLTGLQISIRVWDAKTNQARQVTIVQDL